MTNGDSKQWVSLVAVTSGSDILAVPGPAGPRLPQIADGFPSPAQVLAAGGVGPDVAVIAAPPRFVEGTPARIVHLVSVEDSSPAGTDWVSVDQLDEPADVRDAIGLGTDEWTGRVSRPANRPDWFAPGWSADADRWIDEQLEDLGRRRTGPSEPLKIWSLSAVLRIPTRTIDGDAPAAPVFFKATCEWFRTEPAFTKAIAAITPDHLPRVLAVDHARAWMLMDPLPGDGTEPPVAEAVPAAVVLARLQMELVGHLPVLRAAGLPDRTLQPTCAGLTAVVEDSVELSQLNADERADAIVMLPWLIDRLEAFATVGLPYSVAHGDLHLGNLAVDGDEMTLYDWTDAAISFPFLDAAHLAASARAEVGGSVLAAYADVWSEGYDRVDVERMLELAPLLDRVYQMISYEGIYRSREPDSMWEMRGIVALSLRQLTEQWRLSSGG